MTARHESSSALAQAIDFNQAFIEGWRASETYPKGYQSDVVVRDAVGDGASDQRLGTFPGLIPANVRRVLRS